MTEQSGPIGTLTNVGIDVADLERAEAFYSVLLGVERDWAFEQYVGFKPLPSGVGLYLQRVPDEKISKTRVHMDVTVPNVAAAMVRVEAIGGRVLRDFIEPDEGLAVVADPDGNEFCLIRPQG
ncbi:MAG: VOC family protein [Dehalococcoidia bacterium]|nr:VOC family protein [Dehalococcoidia bacterium]